jgi:hypothetical protein
VGRRCSWCPDYQEEWEIVIMMKQVLGMSAVIGLSAAALLAQDTTVVPVQYLNSNAPAGLNSVLRDAPNARTYQCVYGASELVDIAPGSSITGITWRQYSGGAAAWPTTDADWTQYDVYLSTSLSAPGAMSTTFANNEGPDRVLCHTGPVTMPTGSFPAGSNPPADRFGHVITFSTPFTYNGGDLCVTIRHTGNDTATNAFVCNATNYGTGVHAGYNTTYDATTMAFTYAGPIVAQLTFSAGGGDCNDFAITQGGSCPGPMTISWTGAPVGVTKRVIYTAGGGSGGVIPPGNPCAGTTICIGLAGVTLHPASLPGTASGTSPSFNAPCGLHVQLIGQGSCETSNALVLQ